MFRVKSMLRARPMLGVLIVVGAIVLLFTSYIVSASVGHAQTTKQRSITHSSVTPGSTTTRQVPTSTATAIPTATSSVVVATDTPVVPSATSVPVLVASTPVATTGAVPTVVTTGSGTTPVAGIPTATPVDTASSSIDQLPGNMSYYCDRVQYLGGKWPVHLYIGGCLVSEINQYSWTIDSIKNVLNSTVCTTNEICTISVDTVAYFLHNEVRHILDESNKCGGHGIYVHVFGAFFRTHPVC